MVDLITLKHLIMKNVLLILLLILGIWSCSNDDNGSFNAIVPGDKFTFKPIPGGAIMYYDLKGYKDIFPFVQSTRT